MFSAQLCCNQFERVYAKAMDTVEKLSVSADGTEFRIQSATLPV